MDISSKLAEQCFLNRKSLLKIGPLSVHPILISYSHDLHAMKFVSFRPALASLGRAFSNQLLSFSLTIDGSISAIKDKDSE